MRQLLNIPCQSTRIFAGLILILYSTGGQASPIEINPGNYKVSVETIMPHLEENLRYATTHEKRCLGIEEAATLFPVLGQETFINCNLLDNQADTKLPNYDLVCRNIHAATGTAQFKLSQHNFRAVLKVKMGAKNMKFSQRVSGRRLGDCDLIE